MRELEIERACQSERERVRERKRERVRESKREEERERERERESVDSGDLGHCKVAEKCSSLGSSEARQA